MQAFLLFAAVCFTNVGSAQTTLPNAGFEDWDVEAPTGYFTDEDIMLNGMADAIYPGEPHSGTSSVRIGAGDVFGNYVACELRSGSSLDYPVLPFAGSPVTFRGWIKKNMAAGESFKIQVQTGNYVASENTLYVYRHLEYNVTGTSDWTLFEQPFIVEDAAASNAVSVWITSLFAANPITTSEFFLDDLELVGVGTAVNEANAMSASLYPVPADGTCFVGCSEGIGKWIVVHDALGREVLRHVITETTTKLSLNSGMHLISIVNGSGKTLWTKKATMQ